MATFLHHCPFLKSANKPALRRTGAALLSLAYQCPIIARQISLSGTDYLEAKLSVSPSKPKPLLTVEQRRLFGSDRYFRMAVVRIQGLPLRHLSDRGGPSQPRGAGGRTRRFDDFSVEGCLKDSILPTSAQPTLSHHLLKDNIVGSSYDYDHSFLHGEDF
ncbi:hypothetical protein KUCAC02_012893 [Chaenocephalus aceratus]|uniref:Uncharacterized protein n=1 Tax=Chaenocephalus aceratus TaxID=36190 RepID=A0ACB9XBY3_CHAAC|nr:hypothetical protein KUCAC02_012893 [Chaenocephalus aceratus]